MLQPIDEPPQRLSRAEYRAWADAQPRGRFERHSGVVVAMAPERAIHALLKVHAWLLLRQSVQVHRLPCQVFPDGMTVEIGGDDDFEPDAIVRCGERLADDTTRVPDPLIVVEVLSPSTSATDRSEKLEKYFRLPSVQHYLIVWADRRRVVHHRRDGGSVATSVHTEGTIALDPPGMLFDVIALYAEAAA
jgi:Uma2 family endonuclease